MLSLFQIQAGAYWKSECEIVCVECGDKLKLPVDKQIIRYNLGSDWEDGLYCDDCGAEIVEPYLEEEDENEDTTEKS
jgi:hypothetical protein